MFHHLEDWGDFNSSIVVCVSLILFLKLKHTANIVFLLYLFYAFWKYASLFPDLANHSNFNFFLFFIIFPFHLRIVLDSDTKDLFRAVRVSAIILYFFAFFHKLNWDFFNPEISCANDKTQYYYHYIPEKFNFLISYLKKAAPYFAILIEGLIPFFLCFGNLRKCGIALLILLHFFLAPMGFTDFSALGMALAWSFYNPAKLNTSNLWNNFSLLAGVCFVLEATLSLYRLPFATEDFQFLEGFIFSGLYFAFFFYVSLRAVDTSLIQFPKNLFYKICLLALFVFGASNYLGLRTAGNFSMFSNLRTEGETSNHILLPRNQLRIFSFQDDLVEILFISPFASEFYRNMPAVGQKIPRVEFDHILDRIKRRSRNKKVSMKVKYKGEIIKTADAASDPKFNFHVPKWQKKLFNFRALQAEYDKSCSW